MSQRDSNSPLATHHSPLILGIDPGLGITGYGVLERTAAGPKLVEAGVIRSTERTNDLPSRLVEIHRGVAEVIASLKPAAMALEQLYSHYAHPRTSILMGHARGVICLAAAEAEIPVLHYSATQIKRILTGNGRAPKSQVQRAIERELKLEKPPEPPDVADALAVAICHYYLNQTKLRIPETKARDARQKDAEAKWKLIDTFDVDQYQCGLKAGDMVRLKMELHIIDGKGNRTGKVHHAGEIWGVLTGASEDPVVFLRQPDGEPHAWDDDPSIFDWFEKVDQRDVLANVPQSPAPGPQPLSP